MPESPTKIIRFITYHQPPVGNFFLMDKMRSAEPQRSLHLRGLGSMADEIQFDRKPYFVTWKGDDGQMHKIRRVPPPKLHEALPTDIVELTKKHSDDFKEGQKVTVKGINPRHPNTLQVENEDGQTTFVDYFNMELKEKIAPRSGVPREQLPERNRYLLWP